MWRNLKHQLTAHPDVSEKTRNALSASWNSYIERLGRLPRGSATLSEALEQCSWVGAPVSVQVCVPSGVSCSSSCLYLRFLALVPARVYVYLPNFRVCFCAGCERPSPGGATGSGCVGQ